MSDSFDIDPALIRKLAGLLSETGLAEIEYEDNGKRIRVAIPDAGTVATSPVPAATAAPAAPEAPAASGGGDIAAHLDAVTSPMVGTIYLAQAPEDPPYVKAGDTVSEGQTLMLIEAMKTFNEVKAPRAGKVKSIMVASGQPVEFGEVLAVLE